MLVVDEPDDGFAIEQTGNIERNRLVKLERIARAPEVPVRQEQGEQWRVDFDGGLQIENVVPGVRHLAQVMVEVLDGRKVDLAQLNRLDFPARGAELRIDLNDEVVDVQIVLNEDIVAQVLDRARMQ